MAEKNQSKETSTENGPQVQINAQYIKDLSFENPNAPQSLLPKDKAPHIDLSIDINIGKLQESAFEVALKLTAKATHEDQPLFVTELTYAGVFTFKDVPEDQEQFILQVYCPNIIFPFARRVVADVTRDGGFPPLMIDPIDFTTMFQKRQQEPEAANES